MPCCALSSAQCDAGGSDRDARRVKRLATLVGALQKCYDDDAGDARRIDSVCVFAGVRACRRDAHCLMRAVVCAPIHAGTQVTS